MVVEMVEKSQTAVQCALLYLYGNIGGIKRYTGIQNGESEIFVVSISLMPAK